MMEIYVVSNKYNKECWKFPSYVVQKEIVLSTESFFNDVFVQVYRFTYHQMPFKPAFRNMGRMFLRPSSNQFDHKLSMSKKIQF